MNYPLPSHTQGQRTDQLQINFISSLNVFDYTLTYLFTLQLYK